MVNYKKNAAIMIVLVIMLSLCSCKKIEEKTSGTGKSEQISSMIESLETEAEKEREWQQEADVMEETENPKGTAAEEVSEQETHTNETQPSEQESQTQTEAPTEEIVPEYPQLPDIPKKEDNLLGEPDPLEDGF